MFQRAAGILVYLVSVKRKYAAGNRNVGGIPAPPRDLQYETFVL